MATQLVGDFALNLHELESLCNAVFVPWTRRVDQANLCGAEPYDVGLNHTIFQLGFAKVST